MPLHGRWGGSQNKFGILIAVVLEKGQYSALYDDGEPRLGLGVVSAPADEHWYRSGTSHFFDPIADRKLLLYDCQTGSDRDVSGGHQFIDLHWKNPGHGRELDRFGQNLRAIIRHRFHEIQHLALHAQPTAGIRHYATSRTQPTDALGSSCTPGCSSLRFPGLEARIAQPPLDSQVDRLP